MMPHTKYLGSRSCGFRHKIFYHVFPMHVLDYVKDMTPGRDIFVPRRII